MSRYNVYVNQSQCFACGICEDMCPRRVFRLKPTDFKGPEYEERIPQWMGTITEVVAEDRCFGCRLCENQCPVGVIEVTQFDESVKKEPRTLDSSKKEA